MHRSTIMALLLVAIHSNLFADGELYNISPEHGYTSHYGSALTIGTGGWVLSEYPHEEFTVELIVYYDDGVTVAHQATSTLTVPAYEQANMSLTTQFTPDRSGLYYAEAYLRGLNEGEIWSLWVEWDFTE